MPAIVTKAFKAVKPGEVYPTEFAPGDAVEGRIEEIAREIGAIETPPERAAQPALETAAATAAPEVGAAKPKRKAP